MPLTSKEFGLPARQGSAHNLRVGSIMNLHSARHNWAGLQRTNNDVLAQRMKLFLRSLGGTNEKICAVSLAICVLCLVAIFPCAGQSPDATIAGTITSSAGIPIANAMITIKNVASNVATNLTANADGTYTLKNLAPGRYEITASASGYSAAVTTVSLSVNSSSSANLVLQLVPPGAAGKTSSSSAVSGVVDSNSVSNLPLNGRSASDKWIVDRVTFY